MTKNEEKLRLALSRSNQYLFAQVIENGKTLLGLWDKKFLTAEEIKKPKSERAKIFGLKFAQSALEKKIKKAVFDRGTCRYHGRVKAFVEGLREGGMEI